MKIVCTDCGWKGTLSECLEKRCPFDRSTTINGCPECKSYLSFSTSAFVACDEPGCWQQATCGIPTAGGYRRVCSKHYKELEGQDDA